jgi:hypothetical protein
MLNIVGTSGHLSVVFINDELLAGIYNRLTTGEHFEHGYLFAFVWSGVMTWKEARLWWEPYLFVTHTAHVCNMSDILIIIAQFCFLINLKHVSSSTLSC